MIDRLGDGGEQGLGIGRGQRVEGTIDGVLVDRAEHGALRQFRKACRRRRRWPESSNDRPSRRLPSAARASSASEASSCAIFGTHDLPQLIANLFVDSPLQIECRQRDNTVTGSFWVGRGKQNFTCGGGSSSVLSKALKL